MAARTYFSKSPAELTLAECATVAAITNNPTVYDPVRHPDANRRRRDLILSRMADEGYITAEQRDEAMAAPVELTLSGTRAERTPASWYADLVASDVIRDLSETYGYTYAAASALFYRGGLTVETVMDEELQRIVEDYYADPTHFPEGKGGRPASAFLLIDPDTGDILAVAGAVGEKTGDRLQSYATDTRRPAGSCIKPLTVYAPALKYRGLTWNRLYEDTPLAEKDGRPWPSNADGIYRGRITVGQAMAHSVNTVAVEILREVGEEEAFTFARNSLGMKSLVSPAEGSAHDLTVSSLALGQQSRGVTLRELTAAYTVFAEGIFREPHSYYRVLDAEGNVLLENPVSGEESRVLSETQAALMTKLLQTVTEEGSASAYITRLPEMGIETAGKTGTTQNNCDRRFVGYTPRLLGGVWMGYDYPAEMTGIRGNPCVSIWDELIALCEQAYGGSPARSVFPVPTELITVEFCPLSGELPNEFCTHPIGGHPAETGWFIAGTEPKGVCTVHEEPPVTVPPTDPDEPDRIPLFPEDVLPETETLPPPRIRKEEERPKKRWFSRFFGG
jgi:penicillin-binding protein 1A